MENLRLIILSSLWLFSMNTLCFTQSIESIYFLPGQGSDKRIFDSLEIDSKYKVKYLEYDSLVDKMTMSELARKVATSIDTTETFALVGVSMGGMLSVEISELLNPEKVIIISSAKNRKELPLRYRFQKGLPLFELFPAKSISWGAKTLQPIVEPDRNKNEETFRQMLHNKRPLYLKQTVRMIIQWNRKSNTQQIIHIHGTKDHTIPIRNIKKLDYIVENGSHMMTLTRAKEISRIINMELKK